MLRKQTSEDGRCPLLTTDDEETPTIADGAAVRVVMTPFSDQPAGSAEEDVTASMTCGYSLYDMRLQPL